MAIILKNATYINSVSLEFTSTTIKVEAGTNGKINFYDTMPPVDATDVLIDCSGKLVTKSFGCGHHHVYSALARGMNPPKKIPTNFNEILHYVWWTLDKCLDKDMIEASALTTAMACAKNGVTFVIDHHASPFALEGSLEIIAKAFDKVGVSHLLCYEITDRDGAEIAEKGLLETEAYLAKRQGLVGLHASFTVEQCTLNKAVMLAKKYNSGIHVHVAEDKYDQVHSIDKYGKRVVHRYAEAGVLEFEKTIFGHCLHLDESEKELIRKSNIWVAQNSESNLNNNVGYFDSRGLNKNIMIGTDGMHSDMLRSAKSAFYVGQGFDAIDYPGAYNRFRKVHEYIHKNNFAGDGENNLVVLDYDTPTDFNTNNFYGHFLFGWESKHIQHVISSGKLIVKDKNLTLVNELEILEKSRRLGRILWKKMSE